MRNVSTFAKQLFSLSLFLPRVLYIIANNATQGFCDLFCFRRDIHLRTFLFFVVKSQLLWVIIRNVLLNHLFISFYICMPKISYIEVEAVPYQKFNFWMSSASFFKIFWNFPPITPSSCEMYLLLQKSSFYCHCCFLVNSTSLQKMYQGVLWSFLFSLRYPPSNFNCFVFAFLRVHSPSCRKPLREVGVQEKWKKRSVTSGRDGMVIERLTP